jgi:hypothetical protein
MDLIDAALRCKKPDGRFAYVAPTFTQAKDVVWGYMKRYTQQIPQIDVRESDLSVILPNGARVRLYGSDNYDRMRGLYFDSVVMDEYADQYPQAWSQVIRPALTDRGGTAVFIGTPKGRNAFYDVYDYAKRHPAEWFALELRASQTGLLPNAELESARATLTPEQYSAEFECSFDAAVLGAYYATEIAEAENAGRIGDVPVDPELPVHTAFDLGIGDSTAIWFFQLLGKEVRVVDYYEASGKGLAHYAAVLEDKGYNYGTDWLPHDGMAREMGTGRSRFETLKALTGRHPRIVRNLSVPDGINAARVTIASCWFDAERCRDGLEALRAYHADFDERTKAFDVRPKHNWASHGSDAFRYLAVAWREMQPEKPKAQPPVDHWDRAFERAAAGDGYATSWRTA